MTYRPHFARDLSRRHRARILLLVLFFTLGKGMLPAMAAGPGHSPLAADTPAHCEQPAQHSRLGDHPPATDPTVPSGPAHDSCCPDGTAPCARHCAVPLPVSSTHFTLETGMSVAAPARVPTLVHRALPPPQRPPKA